MDHKINIICIGEKFTGKTSLVKRVTSNTFDSNYRMSLRTSHQNHILHLPTKSGTISLEIIITDTPGQYSLAKKDDETSIQVDAIIMIFDITNARSFDELTKWAYRMIKMKKAPRPLIILGNKNDLEAERVVHPQQVASFIERFSPEWKFSSEHEEISIPIKYSETSVKEKDIESINSIMQYLASTTYNTIRKLEKKIPGQGNNWELFMSKEK